MIACCTSRPSPRRRSETDAEHWAYADCPHLARTLPMNLHRLLLERGEAGRPLRVGLIGAGKFGSMFLAQVLTTPGLHLVAIADLSRARAEAALIRVGWPEARFAATSIAAALESGRTHLI